MTDADTERSWWDTHADRIHVWGEHGEAAWRNGAIACLKIVTEELAPMYARRVLDLGCGLGRLAVPLAELYPTVEVVGVDISPSMLIQAEAFAVAAGAGNVSFVECNGRGLPDDLGVFDAAYCVLVFQHIPLDGVRAYFDDLATVLSPGGRFLAQYVYEDQDDGFLSHAHSLADMDAVATAAGFDQIGTRPGVIYPRWAWTTWERR